MAGFGVFGKIPALGDFLRANLPVDFVSAWDNWLQSTLLAAHSSLGERWDECYLTAPIWRFTLPAGVAGQAAVCGVVMPSVDRVGRRYPLTIATPIASTQIALSHFANNSVFERLEEIALTTLEEETSRDALLHELATIAPLEPEMPGEHCNHYSGPLLPEQVLAARHLARGYAHAAIWTANLEGDHRMLLSNGLPGPAEAAGLFDLSAATWQAGVAARSA